MRLILARHGNTFGPGDKVVWCGARTDLPLVDKGRRQARAIGAALRAAAIRPAAIYCGPLIRTRQTAAEIAAETGVEAARIIVVEGLREVDYGAWEGKSNDEIRAAFGVADIAAWQASGIRPAGAGWRPDEDTIRRNWDDLVAAIERTHGPDDDAVIVSSNGVFRFVAAAIGLSGHASKMATGAVSLVRLTASGSDVAFWNRKPEAADFSR